MKIKGRWFLWGPIMAIIIFTLLNHIAIISQVNLWEIVCAILLIIISVIYVLFNL